MLCGFLRPTACWCLERSHRPLPRPCSLAVAGEAACATRISQVRQCLKVASWGLFQCPLSYKTGVLRHSTGRVIRSAVVMLHRKTSVLYNSPLDTYCPSSEVPGPCSAPPRLSSRFSIQDGLKTLAKFPLVSREIEKAGHPGPKFLVYRNL